MQNLSARKADYRAFQALGVQVLGIAAEHPFSQKTLCGLAAPAVPAPQRLPGAPGDSALHGPPAASQCPAPPGGPADADPHRSAGHRPLAVAGGDERRRAQCPYCAAGPGDDAHAVAYGPARATGRTCAVDHTEPRHTYGDGALGSLYEEGSDGRRTALSDPRRASL